MTKSAQSTAPQYYHTLQDWVTYLCTKWNVQPSEIDYTRATEVRFGEQSYFLPIRTQTVNEYLAQIQYPTARQVAHKVLRVYFGWLVDREVLAANPVPKPDYGSRHRAKKPGLRIDELCQLIEIICTHAPIEVRAPLLLQFAGGLRIGEVCRLRNCDIEELNGQWQLAVRGVPQKGHTEGWVPLPPDIDSTVTEYVKWKTSVPATEDCLFVTSNGRKWRAGELNDHIKRLASMIPGLRVVTTHDLRRGHATIMAANKVSADLERLILRQKSTQIGFGYVRTPLYAGEVRYEDIQQLRVVQLAEEIAKEGEQ